MLRRSGRGAGAAGATLAAVGGALLVALGCSETTGPSDSRPPAGTASRVQVAGPATPRQGNVIHYAAELEDSAGAAVSDPTLAWSVDPDSAGLITADGRFVGYVPGPAMIRATASGAADTLHVLIGARGLHGNFEVIGHGPRPARFTSDLWLNGDAAYTGTWNSRLGLHGDRMYVWDIRDPTRPRLVDSVIVDAGTVNDVKVSENREIAVITHEHSSDGLDGITILRLFNPLRPQPIVRFTTELESGVHNVWIEGDRVYAALDAFSADRGGLRVVDVAERARPRIIGRFYGGSSYLHDVVVRDGLAFLSHWDAGLIILDIGRGIAGGSPSAPAEVGRVTTAGGQVHSAWYWPAAGYVFVTEEDLGIPPGVLHVVDARDPRNPTEVATFRRPGDTPHNLWLDEDRAILYVAWYSEGVRAIDVSGELLGALDRQGREIAGREYAGASHRCGSDRTCAWGVQLDRGLLYVSDVNTGLWVLQPAF